MEAESITGLIFRLLGVTLLAFLSWRKLGSQRWRPRTIQLSRLFLIYCASVVGFAFYYHYLFLGCPNCFAFNSDIREAQAAVQRIRARPALAGYTETEQALMKIVTFLRARPPSLDVTDGDFGWNEIAFFVDGLDVTFSSAPYITDAFEPNKASQMECLSLFNGSHSIGGLHCLPRPVSEARTLRPFRGARPSDELLSFAVELQHKIHTEAETYDKSILHGNKAWSLVDFIYFSTVTQSTLGYGDILPNNSLVRLCVILQVMTGILLLGVLINVITGP